MVMPGYHCDYFILYNIPLFLEQNIPIQKWQWHVYSSILSDSSLQLTKAYSNTWSAICKISIISIAFDTNHPTWLSYKFRPDFTFDNSETLYKEYTI